MSAPVAVAGLFGGLCWLAAIFADRSGETALVDALTWAGVALLTVCVVGAGAGLVSRSTPWLRMVVAVCFAVLVASVLQVLRDAGDPLAVDAVAGLVAAMASLLALVRGRPAETPRRVATAPPHRRGRGSHAR